MRMEYLSNFKPGDIIDLSRFDKKNFLSSRNSSKHPENKDTKIFSPESYGDFLSQELKKMASEVNVHFPGFLEDNGKIALVGPDAKADAFLVASQEDGFSRDFHGGAIADINDWKRKQESSDPSLTEISLTLLLNKFLKNDFIVARASSYDDYNNGIDNVLIDKNSGEVLCGFDEVIVKKGETNSAKKESKLNRLMSKDGAYLKYGARLEHGRLVRSVVKNIPAFYISLDKTELVELMNALRTPADSPDLTNSQEVERRIFQKLLTSLEHQLANYHINNNLRHKSLSVLSKLQPFNK